MKTTTAVTSVAATPSEAEPIKLQKRIGSTVYTVSIHFCKTSRDTAEDKILRLIREEASEIA